MATMIPAVLSDDTRSDAERDLFHQFKTAPNTSDWVVLHSLNLTARNKKPYGEIDFVLLVPGGGIFAIEVKGGGIRCENGSWSSIDRLGQRHSLNRSPFKQAQEGMWQLRAHLASALGVAAVDKLVFGSAAIFPDTDFTIESIEWAAYEVLDRRKCTMDLILGLKAMMAGHARRLNMEAKVFDASQLKVVRRILRPDFECVISASTTLKHVEQQILRLTEDQFGALDSFQFNNRLLCEGPAGTGKTMLALELARRETSQGRRTLLLCFNRLLGSWLTSQALGIPGLTAGSFHLLGKALIENQRLVADFAAAALQPSFWRHEFPALAWQAIEERNEKFDTLIVDEAQDLASPLELDVLDAWTTGGLNAGRWAMFADFQRQAIFGSGADREHLYGRTKQLTCWQLRMNCRNTKRIARETALLSGFDRPPYRMGQIDGVPVDASFYADDEEAAEKLAERINKLLADGVSPDDIVVISNRKFASSCAVKARHGMGFLLVEGDEVPLRSRVPVIPFVTVQAFKGMESQVVIMCDITAMEEPVHQSLLYIGMSRARLQLILLMKAELRSAYDECRARRFTTDWK